MEQCLILAHRGASGDAPENTLQAFRLATEQGADGLEVDLRYTKDKQIVVHHDETLERMAGIKGRVQDYTLAELREMNFAGSHTSLEPQRILTLAELLDFAQTHRLYLNIEIKHSYKSFWLYRDLAVVAARQVAERDMQEQVIFSSFAHFFMMQIKRKFPDQRCGILYEKNKGDRIRYAARIGMDALHPYFGLVDSETIARAKQEKLLINTWTVNTEEDIERMLDYGVNAIITNYPAKALAVARQRGIHD